MLLSLKAVQELRRLCDDSDKPIEIRVSGSDAFFSRENFSLSVKLIDATFPPYKQVIPQRVEAEARVSLAALIDALRAMSVGALGVRLTIGAGKICIASQSAYSCEACDEISAEYDGPETIVGVNARYMLDALRAIEAEDVSIGVTGDLGPIVLRPLSGQQFVAIVMPMRL